MGRARRVTLVRVAAIGVLFVSAGRGSLAQQVTPQFLNEHCTVSVLNRTVTANADGSWVLPNVPANFGPVRARATCVVNGQTISGESAPFSVPSNGIVNVPTILFGQTTPIPTALTMTGASGPLTQAGAAVPLTATARYPDGSTKDVTAGNAGTTYTVSNAAIATVSADGLVTAVTSGTVIVQATHEGASGMTSVRVILGAASPSGIEDAWAIANGLNPNDPTMPFQDPDRDGLTNLQEFERGTDPRNPDTDGDGLKDGDEVNVYRTNPLLKDTDGDGIPDGVEVQNGTNPLDPNSYDLTKALKAVAVAPSSFVLTFNTIAGDAPIQLKIVGTLLDGTTLDVTSKQRGTNYSSSDVNVCNFGQADGQVFAGVTGSCTITITVAGFTVTATGAVHTFSPVALSYVAIPGFANNVDVRGDYAYVAAGSAGLQVVDVSNRTAPRIVASLPLPGNANDVKLAGTVAYVACGSAGLRVVDVSNPLAPHVIGAVDTPGDASDVRLHRSLAFVADGPGGLRIIDVSNSAAPRVIGSLATSDAVNGVDATDTLALLAAGSTVRVVDVSTPSSPRLIGTRSLPGVAQDLVVRGTIAYVADYTGSLQIVDFSTPSAPVVVGTTSQALGGILVDVAASGPFVLGADVFFVNGVPIVDASTPSSPIPRAILDFKQYRDDNGTGIAVDGSYVYLTAARSVEQNGISGDTRLYIGQYLSIEDLAGIPPTVSVVSPSPGVTFVEGETIPIAVAATDDVAVAAVNFLVNGAVIGTATSPPYAFNLVAPRAIGQLTIGATAGDLGNNVGTAASVDIHVIQDPFTTVVATIVDTGGQPVNGAVVSITGGRSGVSGQDGSVVFSQVQTIFGPLQAKAVFTAPDGTPFAAVSAFVPPVRGGVTDLGTLTVVLAFAIVQPVDGARVVESSRLALVAHSSPSLGVASVTFEVNGQNLSPAGPPDFTSNFDVPSVATTPTITVTAVARNAGGIEVGRDQVVVKVIHIWHILPSMFGVGVGQTGTLRLVLGTAEANDITVTLSAVDPTVVTFATNPLVIEAGRTEKTFEVHGASVGNTTVNATADIGAASAIVSVSAPGSQTLFVEASAVGLSLLRPPSVGQAITLVSATQTVRVPLLSTPAAQDTPVSVSTSNAAVANVSGAVVVRAGQQGADVTILTGVAGTATLTLKVAGSVVTLTVIVGTPPSDQIPPVVALSAGLALLRSPSVGQAITPVSGTQTVRVPLLSTPAAQDTPVSVSTSNAAVANVSGAVVVRAGQQGADVTILTGVAGTATLTLNVAGSVVTLTVIVGTPPLDQIPPVIAAPVGLALLPIPSAGLVIVGVGTQQAFRVQLLTSPAVVDTAVAVSNSNSQVATVSGPVVVKAGELAANISVQTGLAGIATLTLQVGGQTQQVTVIVGTPPPGLLPVIVAPVVGVQIGNR